MFKKLNHLKLYQKFILVLIGLLIMIPGGLATEAKFKEVNYPGREAGGVPLTFDLDKKNRRF